MALPPEPLEDVLPAASVVAEAEVVAVEDLGAWPAGESHPPLDGAAPRPAQRVTLRVTRALRGSPAAELVVTKPEGAYALYCGARGAFLIDAGAAILGRYGPDSYGVDEVVHALGAGR